MNEWVGPPYLQIPRANHLAAALLLWAMFPRGMRTNHLGIPKGRWTQVAATDLDKSEACNSPELLPQFLRYFRPIKIALYGGLAYPVFEGIAQNVREHRWQNQVRLRVVDYAERLLTGAGLIDPLFVTVVAEKRADVVKR